MHKLSHKSSDLIPPAQHRLANCTASWNKFIFFFLLSSVVFFLSLLLKHSLNDEETHNNERRGKKLFVGIAAVCGDISRAYRKQANKKTRREIFCERSIIENSFGQLRLRIPVADSCCQSLLLCNCFIVTHFFFCAFLPCVRSLN